MSPDGLTQTPLPISGSSYRKVGDQVAEWGGNAGLDTRRCGKGADGMRDCVRAHIVIPHSLWTRTQTRRTPLAAKEVGAGLGWSERPTCPSAHVCLNVEPKQNSLQHHGQMSNGDSCVKSPGMQGLDCNLLEF